MTREMLPFDGLGGNHSGYHFGIFCSYVMRERGPELKIIMGFLELLVREEASLSEGVRGRMMVKFKKGMDVECLLLTSMWCGATLSTICYRNGTWAYVAPLNAMALRTARSSLLLCIRS